MSRIELSKNIIKNGLIVEVCGGLASCKTTFASLMTRIDLIPIFEDFKKSPFWKAFYLNPGKYIFETEISFILLHYHQIKKAFESSDGSKFVCDFSFLLDLAYAKMSMSGTKLNAFECVLNEIRKELPKPSLIVYLKCDAKTELDRIRRRDRTEEKFINLDFLTALNSALLEEVTKTKDIPIITVDSAAKDFANDEQIKEDMVKTVDDFLKTLQ